MTRVYRVLSQSSWALGLLGILAAVIVGLFHLTGKLHHEPRSFLILACSFFLCVLATRAIERT